VVEQLLMLVAVTEGAFEGLPAERMAALEDALRARVDVVPGVRADIERGDELTDEDVQEIVELARSVR
jgi:hypothetical protein